ncbi:MAG: DUF4935 domain-containing protein [Desulfobacteraceae bacterium]|nr:DUF4935 domain-containing protein [Desulfobacteraceae bacterium]
MRQDIKISHLEGAKELLKKQRQNKISIVITTTVENEYNDHLNNICIELERYMLKLASSNEKMINTIESVGIKYEFNVHKMNEIKLSDTLKQIADEIIASSYIIERDDECIKKAHTRIERYSAPSKRGKSESKDCVIVEHFLKTADELRKRGVQDKFVFITTNSNDYGTAPNLKPPLDIEFHNLQSAYCNNFKWGIHQAG